MCLEQQEQPGGVEDVSGVEVDVLLSIGWFLSVGSLIELLRIPCGGILRCLYYIPIRGICKEGNIAPADTN